MKIAIKNALLAVVYIVAIVSGISYSQHALGTRQETIIVPIAMLCLFTLSAAVMGYLFVYTPITMYLDGKKKEAVQLFLQTVGVFAVITLLVFVIMFTGVFS